MPFGIGLATIVNAVVGGESSVVSEALGFIHRMDSAMKFATGGALNRVFLDRVIPGFVREGLSGNMAYNLMRRVGVGIRRQDFLRAYKTGREYVQVQDYVHSLTMDERLDSVFARPVDLPYGDKYTAKVWVEWRDPITGELHEQYITMGVNEGETKGALFKRLLDSMTVWYGVEGGLMAGDVEEWEIDDFMVNPSWVDPWEIRL